MEGSALSRASGSDAMLVSFVRGKVYIRCLAGVCVVEFGSFFWCVTAACPAGVLKAGEKKRNRIHAYRVSESCIIVLLFWKQKRVRIASGMLERLSHGS